MRTQYPAYGLWEVTTEGDVEGRTVTNLDVHEGFLDDIAFRLGGKAYYSLQFKLLNPAEQKTPKELLPVDSVSVTLFVDSGTWDMKSAERAVAVSEILKGRPVTVSQGTFYASVILSKRQTNSE